MATTNKSVGLRLGPSDGRSVAQLSQASVASWRAAGLVFRAAATSVEIRGQRYVGFFTEWDDRIFRADIHALLRGAPCAQGVLTSFGLAVEALYADDGDDDDGGSASSRGSASAGSRPPRGGGGCQP